MQGDKLVELKNDGGVDIPAAVVLAMPAAEPMVDEKGQPLPQGPPQGQQQQPMVTA